MAWWVIPEGTAGVIVGQFAQDIEHGDLAGLAGTGALFTVTQAAAKPSGAVGNSYVTQAAAQAEANSLNAVASKASQPTVSNIASGVGSALGIPTLNGAALRAFVIRAAKVVLGLVLVVAGVIQLAHPEKAIGTITKAAALA